MENGLTGCPVLWCPLVSVNRFDFQTAALATRKTKLLAGRSTRFRIREKLSPKRRLLLCVVVPAIDLCSTRTRVPPRATTSHRRLRRTDWFEPPAPVMTKRWKASAVPIVTDQQKFAASGTFSGEFVRLSLPGRLCARWRANARFSPNRGRRDRVCLVTRARQST